MARFVRISELAKAGSFVLNRVGVSNSGNVKLAYWVFLAVLLVSFLGEKGFAQSGTDAALHESAVKVEDSSSKPATVAESKGAPEPSKQLPKQESGAAAQVADDTYRIGIEDDLQVSVWHEPELSTQVVVRPDGVITLPLLNDVHVVGLTPKQLQAELTEKLKAYVTEPQVTVIVRGIRSRKVYLIGEVGHTGVFPLNTRMTVLQLLAEAGGLSPYAKGDDIYVMRSENGLQKKLRFRYKKALRGDEKEDFELEPGDMIVVP
jgi:polysaccharide export outer membrane protein